MNNQKKVFRVNFLILLLFGFLGLVAMPLLAQEQPETEQKQVAAAPSTIATLTSFVELKRNLQKDMQAVNRQLQSAQTDAEKANLKQQLEKLESDLKTTNRNFENIAAGVDMTTLRGEVQEEFNLQQEVFSLLRPAIDEMKEITARVRQKSELKKKIAYYQGQLPIITEALANVQKLEQSADNKTLLQSLKQTAEQWAKQQAFIQSELQAAQLQLDKLSADETSFTEASQSYLKSFFQKRGLYLTIALAVVIGIALLSRLSASAMQRFIPGFRAKHRSFRIRLIELLHRVLTVLLSILGPMAVFYIVEDWVLFSLGILLLFGIAWALRQTLPRYWSQVQLFLNVGSVREGERLLMEGLPWRVEQINVFSTLVNPVAGISQRVPIDELVDLKSRPSDADEPWFPCSKGDWVILDSGVRGKVNGISHEFVQLVQRGGARVTYQMADFLAASPRNLATNFRIKEIIGLSYDLQKEITGTIPETLQNYLLQRLQQEGYADQLLNMRVEFNAANNSSLDLVVIADFKGEVGDLYNRFRRAIQRWCVDACSENGWEIPFPQLTLHGALSRAE
ncbi:mechanosensitive ion channel family protein [Sedimenticola thiotaurini]|uniref:mechanosensitive ion channel family protein n=1 Tax=Sedimenticola thiotaurini TaxID=1543721 RepID=UPI0007B06B97|nr:mechanosensitive ion channel family protein [Sedimenticola thiotaurini]